MYLTFGLACAHFCTQTIPLTNFSSSFASDILTLSHIIFIFLLIAVLVCFVRIVFLVTAFLVSKFRDIVKLKETIFYALIIISTVGLVRLEGVLRYETFANITVKAQPLIKAISLYVKENGKAPARLSDLVPKYIKKIPNTEVSAYPDFVYGVLKREDFSQLEGEFPLWELKVECSIGFLNWDVFIYWPTEKYPSNIYGGSTELIRNWAYVHE